MAVFSGTYMTAPSAERITLTELDTRTVEPGIYYCNEQKTILGTTSSNWAVIVSGQGDEAPITHSQIWVPTLSNSVPRMFIRHSTGSGYTNFYEVYTTANLVISDTQPSAPASGQIIWIDTCS